jgi:hypothetical protein
VTAAEAIAAWTAARWAARTAVGYAAECAADVATADAEAALFALDDAGDADATNFLTHQMLDADEAIRLAVHGKTN